jgi:hypothetical protein
VRYGGLINTFFGETCDLPPNAPYPIPGKETGFLRQFLHYHRNFCEETRFLRLLTVVKQTLSYSGFQINKPRAGEARTAVGAKHGRQLTSYFKQKDICRNASPVQSFKQ